METPGLRLLSLGGGVQSTTLLLRGLTGEFGPPPEAAIFADTQWEPAAVYRHLVWLEREVRPFPIYRVTAGNIRTGYARARTDGSHFAALPTFVRNPDGSQGIGRRQCTDEFKVRPIARQVRALLTERGLTNRTPGVVEQWIGISLDECSRMKDARVRYIRHRWPLIEARMTRQDCLRWLALNGYPTPPKSACVGCPFHSDRQWREIREQPEEWAEAVAFDREIRGGMLTGENYLHRSLVPLDQVDLRTDGERGQINLFENDCTGYCGV